MAKQLWGFDSEAAFARAREAIHRSERDVGTNRVPQTQHGGSIFGGRILVCRTTEAGTQGSLCTCEIYDGTTQGSEIGTGVMIKVFLRLGDAASGDWIYVAETVRGYEALNVPCAAA